MALGKQMVPWLLALFLGGCTFSAVEKSDATTDSDPRVNMDVASTNAGVEIKFIEGAPKDSFVITNTGSCALEDLMVQLDLSQSAGMLIFDTTSTGAGVEVFQPFEVEEGDIVPLVADGVKDGDAEIALRIASLGQGDSASFTIDVDDTLPTSDLGQIRVADSEISGAIASFTIRDSAPILATFSGSTARANLSTCPATGSSHSSPRILLTG